MGRKIFMAVVGAIALGALAVPAAAQTTKPIGLSVRAGVIFPTSSFGRDIGRNWFGVGGEFRVADANFGTTDRGTTSFLTVSADYYGKGSASAVPILLNFVSMTNEFYFTGGIGVAFTRDTAGVGVPPISTGRNRTNVGYQLGVGYNFQQGQNPLFVEAKFWGNGNSNLNAIGLYVGVRL